MSRSPVLQARKLCMSFGGIRAVDNVDLCIEAQALLCVIGPNGAGKSTLLNLVSGTLAPSAGGLRIAGVDMLGRSEHQFARRGVIRKFQGTNTFQWMTVRDNLVVAGLGVVADRTTPMPDVDEVLARVGLQDRAGAIAEWLPHGDRQWLEIGMALMGQPVLLLLDEPVAGMNMDGRLKMVALLRRLSQRLAVVVVEHDIAFVRSLDCRTLVMHQGAIVREGSFDAVARDEEIRDIYLGRAAGVRHAAHR